MRTIRRGLKYFSVIDIPTSTRKEIVNAAT